MDAYFAFRSAANRADLFRFCRAKAAGLPFLTNWTKQAVSPDLLSSLKVSDPQIPD
jgi:hypothetical protein